MEDRTRKTKTKSWEQVNLKKVKKKPKRSAKRRRLEMELCNPNTSNSRRNELIEEEIEFNRY